MIRSAALYGLWAGSCLLATILIILAPEPFSSGVSWENVRSILRLVIPTSVVAMLGWMVAHRNGRQPGRWGYAGLAILVVVVSHIVVIVIGIRDAEDLFMILPQATLLLAVDFWFTFPVALAGTALFVFWNRRRAAA